MLFSVVFINVNAELRLENPAAPGPVRGHSVTNCGLKEAPPADGDFERDAIIIGKPSIVIVKWRQHYTTERPRFALDTNSLHFRALCTSSQSEG